MILATLNNKVAVRATRAAGAPAPLPRPSVAARATAGPRPGAAPSPRTTAAADKPLAARPPPMADAAAPPAPPASAAASAAVKIVIQGRRLPVTPAIRDYVQDKVGRAVAHFSSDVRRIDVTLSARGGDTGTHGPKAQKVDVTIHTVRHGLVRVEDSEGSLYASIDVACDKIGRKLRKVKELAMARGTWTRGRGKAGARRSDAAPGLGEGADDDGLDEDEDDEEAGLARFVAVDSADESSDDVSAAERAASPFSGAGALPAEVARVKVVPCAAMSVADAAEAMDALGHGFYVFREASTGGVAVVYRRESGGYGVLVPSQ